MTEIDALKILRFVWYTLMVYTFGLHRGLTLDYPVPNLILLMAVFLLFNLLVTIVVIETAENWPEITEITIHIIQRMRSKTGLDSQKQSQNG